LANSISTAPQTTDYQQNRQLAALMTNSVQTACPHPIHPNSYS
jgi:hypothetical protein